MALIQGVNEDETPDDGHSSPQVTYLAQSDADEILEVFGNWQHKCSTIKSYLIDRKEAFKIDDDMIERILSLWADEQSGWEDYISGDGWRSTADPYVRDNIRDTLKDFPDLKDDYRLLDRIGQGTFSYVYKAVDIHHEKFENTWCKCSNQDSAAGATVCGLVAIKILFRNAAADRIYHEIHALNSSNLDDETISMDDIRSYLRSLFSSLKSIHEAGSYGLVQGGSSLIPISHKSLTGKLSQKSLMLKSEVAIGDADTLKKDGTKVKLGYLKNDKRRAVKANRNGTRGFRAPEVLLKVPNQTTGFSIFSLMKIHLI
ncbi:hypothetical protein HDU67_001254 [Dinochytrium kinnereticum]|nr:hypothetical protein HDU67_001254 [Dinochytrium kinnereticum]